MPLDEATRRFAFLLQKEARRLSHRKSVRGATADEVLWDSVSRIATVRTPGGEIAAKLYGEVLATYAPEDRILRWAWVGRPPSTQPTHGDVVVREGQARGVPQLAMSVVGDLEQEEAESLVRLGAVLARAEGIYERRLGVDVQYIGLFERSRPAISEPGHMSIPPPPTRPKSEPPPPARPAYRSLPPIREIFEPRASHGSSRPPPDASSSSRPASALRPIREPSRTIFLPVANAALAALEVGSKGYLQGLFVVTVDQEGRGGDSKRRVVVQLVVVDVAGTLRALDPPESLIEAVVTMIEADRRDGNGAWRKLSARITPKPNGGATLNVDVT